MATKNKQPSHTTRNLTVGAAAIGAIAVAIGAAFRSRRIAALFRGNAEHTAPDLALDAPVPGTDRAPDAFRPDPTAPVPASEREGLRPATGPAPTLVQDRGAMRSQTAPANG